MKSIKVMVVDDSFTMRVLISDILNLDPHIEVIAAVKSGEEAIAKLPLLKPDCITLDLLMPGMDGLSTLRAIMAKYPTPTIILSSQHRHDADITFKCLANGAVSFIPKPSVEPDFELHKIQDQLLESIKSVVHAHLNWPLNNYKTFSKPYRCSNPDQLVVMGASTGGPQTLERILSSFPADFEVPMLIAQHMPAELFMESFVKRLNNKCWLDIKLAEHQEPIQLGRVYCIPSHATTSLISKGRETHFWIEEADSSDRVCPSIDKLMISAAKVYKQKTIGVILSGMGNDGVNGMRQIKKYGGKTIAQNEAALLYGMPKAVVDAGLADEILAMEDIPSAIVERLTSD